MDNNNNYKEKITYVGIGASAGGLEAIESFFQNINENKNFVYIVVQHLSPNYKSLMKEILSRHTKMPIHIIEDGMETKAGNIYLIPPSKNLSIFHSKLFLEDIGDRTKLNLPIDKFFKSLAIDQEENAIGIILSGTGSDGTLGIKSIKEKGGLVVVQTEESAKFDGMPLSSISTGLADIILPPEKMPEAIENFINFPASIEENSSNLNDDMDGLTKVIIILRDFSGIDFSYYKQSTIIRRLERRIMINQTNNINDYISFLRSSDKEKDILFREMLIGVTSFFRNQDAFSVLKEKIIPSLDFSKKLLRLWVPGCSTGEEVYSIAMLLENYIRQNEFDCTYKIFATDIDRFSLETAGFGFYNDSLVSEIDQEYLIKYFLRKGDGYIINEEIRKNIVFAKHNVIKDPPFSKLDLISCRNLFIYFNADIQQNVLSKFYFSLSSKGYLFLGSSESIGDMKVAFRTIDRKWKFYQAKDDYKPILRQEIVGIPEDLQINRLITGNKIVRSSLTTKMEKVLIEAMNNTLPPSLIVNANDEIIQVINDVNGFLTFKSGRFDNNIFTNVSKNLSAYISGVLRRLRNDENKVVIKNISGLKGLEEKILSISGIKLDQVFPEAYMIIFNTDDVIKINKNLKKDIHEEFDSSDDVNRLENELQFARESLQATIEELETSNEELQSSNEELIASNEELQSTNEELQSVNEELFTVNNEYHQKIDEITQSNNDLSNLLINLEVGAIYLDQDLLIRRITPIVSKITNIRESDLGRPVSHLQVFSGQVNLISEVENVMNTLQSKDLEIVDNNNISWLLRIKPYRTENGAVDGIIATFNELTALNKEIRKAEKANQRLNELMDTAQIAWWEWDIKTGHVFYDDLKATMLGYSPDEFPNDVYEICDLIHPDDYESTMNIMRDHLEGKTEKWDARYRIIGKDGKYKIYHDQGSVTLRGEDGSPLYAKGSVIALSD